MPAAKKPSTHGLIASKNWMLPNIRLESGLIADFNPRFVSAPFGDLSQNHGRWMSLNEQGRTDLQIDNHIEQVLNEKEFDEAGFLEEIQKTGFKFS